MIVLQLFAYWKLHNCCSSCFQLFSSYWMTAGFHLTFLSIVLRAHMLGRISSDPMNIQLVYYWTSCSAMVGYYPLFSVVSQTFWKLFHLHKPISYKHKVKTYMSNIKRIDTMKKKQHSGKKVPEYMFPLRVWWSTQWQHIFPKNSVRFTVILFSLCIRTVGHLMTPSLHNITVCVMWAWS